MGRPGESRKSTPPPRREASGPRERCRPDRPRRPRDRASRARLSFREHAFPLASHIRRPAGDARPVAKRRGEGRAKPAGAQVMPDHGVVSIRSLAECSPVTRWGHPIALRVRRVPARDARYPRQAAIEGQGNETRRVAESAVHAWRRRRRCSNCQ